MICKKRPHHYPQRPPIQSRLSKEALIPPTNNNFTLDFYYEPTADPSGNGVFGLARHRIFRTRTPRATLLFQVKFNEQLSWGPQVCRLPPPTLGANKPSEIQLYRGTLVNSA